MIASSLILPCGAVLKNRIAKSAMSENLADEHHQADGRLTTLYQRWARGGAGLVITGNVMIDARHLGEPRNVVIEKQAEHASLKEWATAGTENGTHLWVQLNHPGKQIPAFLNPHTVAPSAIGFSAPLDRRFAKPRALRAQEIIEIVDRFATAAGIAKDSGFTGVQIHGAHGYLVSQFLSPKHNRRRDEWGGNAENRRRFVLEVTKAIRRRVGPEFPIGIKLNSADFQKGGFSQAESFEVIQALDQTGIDLIEVSGGTYEAPVMMGKRASTQAREAYFAEYCQTISGKTKAPIMLTGGFRTSRAMKKALNENICQIIGLARSLAIDPDLPAKVLAGEDYQTTVRPLTTGIKFVDKLVPLEITWYAQQMARMAHGSEPDPSANVPLSVAKTLLQYGSQMLRKTRA